MDDLKAYRRRILFAYTVAGVAASLLCVFAFTSDMLQEIPLPQAMGFLAIMIVPLCIGSIVAKDVTSTDDDWSPFSHWQALKAEAPILFATIAAILIADALLYLAELPRLMAFPPILAAWFMNRWTQET